MTPTTPSALKDDFITQIKAISPSHSRHQDKTWARVYTQEEVRNAEIRTFCVDNAPGRASDMAWCSGGRTRIYTMFVWTSYFGLAADDDDSIIEEDAVQLENAFHRRVDPTVNGLWMVESVGEFQESDYSEPGKKWGAHVFEVTYIASNTS